VLKQLGSHHVLVVSALDGLDEITLNGETQIAELKDGQIHLYKIKPEDLGLKQQSLDGLSVGSANESLALIHEALSKRRSPTAQKAADMIALNAGAAIYVAGIADTLKEGVEMAEDAIGSGIAKAKIQELAVFSECCHEVSN
jgi:anthranilate phosphoribosyltransferase